MIVGKKPFIKIFSLSLSIFYCSRASLHCNEWNTNGRSPHPKSQSKFYLSKCQFCQQHSPSVKQWLPFKYVPRDYLSKCQFCEQQGHSQAMSILQIYAKKIPTITSSPFTVLASQWLIDSGASHHAITDLNSMSSHSNYTGSDGIMIGDGTGLSITQIGSTTLSSPSIFSFIKCSLCFRYKKELDFRLLILP